MNDNIIDLGKIDIPASWDDLSLEKYEKIEKYYADKEDKFNIIDVLDILIDKDRDWINSLPSEFLDTILAHLVFLTLEPEVGEATNKITIDGEDYKINVQNKLKVGEYVAADAVIKADKHNYAALLAILCRKEDEIYDSRFENEVLEDRIKLFERQPVTKILPLISFFLHLLIISEIPSQMFSQVEEGINYIQQTLSNSQKIGASKRLYLTLQMKKYKKLLKSIKST